MFDLGCGVNLAVDSAASDRFFEVLTAEKDAILDSHRLAQYNDPGSAKF